MKKLNNVDDYEFVTLNDIIPTTAAPKYEFIQSLKKNGLPLRAVLYMYSWKKTFYFVWKIPEAATESAISTKLVHIEDRIKEFTPTYHTREMKKEFRKLFGIYPNIKPMFLREVYRNISGDKSSPESKEQAEIDAIVHHAFINEDPNILELIDKRVDNSRPLDAELQLFYDATRKYIEDIAELNATPERRHGEHTYMAVAHSFPHLMRKVSEANPDLKVPSLTSFTLQFCPVNPTTKTASRHTGKINIKRMVQRRQYRKTHIDDHYCAALFR